MDPDRKTDKQRGSGPACVRNILSGNGTGGVTLWDGDLGFVGGNVQESRGGAHGFPQTVDGSEGHAVEGRDLEKRGSGEGNQGSRNSDTGDVNFQEEGNSGRVGGFEDYD